VLLLPLLYGIKRIFLKRAERLSYPNEAILITGCDSGIGLELAKYSYRYTRFTVICGFLDTTSEGFQQLSDIRSTNDDGRLFLEVLDITNDLHIRKMLEKIQVMTQSGKIRHLFSVINNAGILTYGELDWLTCKQVQEQINVNLVGTIQLTRSMVPLIIESKGRIINISSVNDSTVFPGLSVYSATKSAISTFSRGLGYELRKFGAHVVTIRLGDFARLTNIMANHSVNRDMMWQEMASEKRDLYKDYFDQFNSHLMENYGMTSPKNFNDSNFFKDFRLALLSDEPPTTITCAPLMFRIFYFVNELLPVACQYRLLDLMLHFAFRWKT